MANKNQRDYAAMREEWIDRSLRGEKVSVRSFAAEIGVPYDTLQRQFRVGRWREHLQEREAAIGEKVREAAEISHIEARLRLLRAGYRAQELLMEELNFYLEKRRAARDDEDGAVTALEPKDLRAIGSIAKDLIEIGAGLPKEHVVHVDEAHEEVTWNREQQREAQDKVTSIREWKARRDAGRRKRKSRA